MVRQFYFRRVALVVFTVLLLVSAASVSEAVFGAGDFCWTVKITQDEQGPVTKPGFPVKFHIKSLDPTTFVMTGRVTVPGDNPFVLTGTATKIGTIIIANLTTTQSHKDGWRDTGIMQVTINSDTLAGTFFDIGHDFDVISRGFDQRFAGGKLTPVACQ